jgi:hypothetical protein
MSLFEEVGLRWAGEEYIVPSDKVMGLIEVIEDIITIEEMTRDGIKRAKLSRAFSAALRYAGAKVTQEQVYESLFGAEKLASTSGAVMGLLALMIPPSKVQEAKKAEGKPAKKAPARKKAAVKR